MPARPVQRLVINEWGRYSTLSLHDQETLRRLRVILDEKQRRENLARVRRVVASLQPDLRPC